MCESGKLGERANAGAERHRSSCLYCTNRTPISQGSISRFRDELRCIPWHPHPANTRERSFWTNHSLITILNVHPSVERAGLIYTIT